MTKHTIMPFSAEDRALLLAVKGVGPTVIARLEQMGIDRLSKLAQQNPLDICSQAAGLVGSSCWKNSPQARKAIEAAIGAAQSAVNKRK
jgi:predicted RecB family nuclease